MKPLPRHKRGVKFVSTKVPLELATKLLPPHVVQNDVNATSSCVATTNIIPLSFFQEKIISNLYEV